MRTFKLLTLLILGFLIFGSAGYFGYELFIKPGRSEKREKAVEAAAPSATATPDPGIPEFLRLQKVQSGGDISGARDGWIAWIASNPSSPKLGAARKLLGDANMDLLFKPSSNPSTISYTVAKGDSLARIASRHQSNAELIQRANQLPNINLQIGQVLVIPSLKTSLELDRTTRKLTLMDNGTFVKEYSLLSAPSAPKSPSNINSKVLDKVATQGTKRVAFGDKAYASSEKSILLTQAPAIVAVPAPPPSGAMETSSTNMTPATGKPAITNAVSQPPPTLPGGYVLAPEDLQEIFPLVSRNTPVIIH